MDNYKEQQNNRLEALKLAFDVSFKCEEFNKRQTAVERYESLMSIFELADLNYNYIVKVDQ